MNRKKILYERAAQRPDAHLSPLEGKGRFALPLQTSLCGGRGQNTSPNPVCEPRLGRFWARYLVKSLIFLQFFSQRHSAALLP